MDICGCKRCKGCTSKRQKSRKLCSNCKNKRCECKICGQKIRLDKLNRCINCGLPKSDFKLCNCVNLNKNKICNCKFKRPIILINSKNINNILINSESNNETEKILINSESSLDSNKSETSSLLFDTNSNEDIVEGSLLLIYLKKNKL